MRDRWGRGTTIGAVIALGVAAWVAQGDLTLTDALPGARRVGVLAPWWMLAAALAISAIVVAAVRAAGGAAAPLWVAGLALVPWLPLPVPAEMLAWAAPLSALLLAVAVAAALAAREPARAEPRNARGGPPLGPLTVFLAALAVYTFVGWSVTPVLPGGDEPHYLIITESLLADRDLAIENNHAQGGYRAYFNGPLTPHYLRRGTDQRIYSIHLPGLPALVAPAFAAGGYPLAKLWLTVLAAFASAVAWRVAWSVSRSAPAAWFAWAATALTSPFVFLTFAVYPDGPGGLCVAVSLAGLVSLAERRDRQAWWWVAMSAAPAALPWLHPRFAVIAGALGAVFMARALGASRPGRAMAAYAALPAASALGWFGYYYALYGSLNPSSAYGHYSQMAASNMGRGLLGLLFDQQFGLVAAAPVFLLAGVGVVVLAREHRRLALEWVLIVVPYACVSAMYHMWWGGQSSPARFLGPLMPACALPVAMAWRGAASAASRTTGAVLLTVSIVLSATLASVDGGRLVFNTRDGLALWASWASRAVDIARGLPSVFRTDVPTAFVSAAVWVAGIVCMWLLVRTAERRATLTRGTAAAATATALVCAATVAMSLSWRQEHAAAAAPIGGQLRLLNRVAGGSTGPAILLDPPAIAAPADALRMIRIRGGETRRPAWAWFWLSGLPAGKYRISFDVRDRGAPLDVDVVFGRGEAAAEVWHLEAAAPGRVFRDLDLPRSVRSIALRGTPETRARVARVTLEPLSVIVPAPAGRIMASRRYGRTLVMAIGDTLHLEGPGAWAAALVPVEAVLQGSRDSASQRVHLRAGPVATVVDLRTGGWSERLSLAPGEERDVDVPLAAGTATLSVRTDAGFRPADIDPASTDTRHLGVWIEFR